MEIEKNQDKLVKEKAKEIIEKHKKYIGEEIANKAIGKIEKDEKKTKKAEEKKEELDEKNICFLNDNFSY